MSKPQVEYNNAKRAAQLTLDETDDFSPVYLQLAAERMLQAISAMTAPRLGTGEPAGKLDGEPSAQPNEQPRQLVTVTTSGVEE